MKKLVSVLLVAFILAMPLYACEKTPNYPEVSIAVTSEVSENLVNYIRGGFDNKGLKSKVVMFDSVEAAYDAMIANKVDLAFTGNRLDIEGYNETHSGQVLSLNKVYFHTYAIFPYDVEKRIDDLRDGANVALPSEGYPLARALQLLAAQGLFTIKEGAGLSATLDSVENNEKNLQFVLLPEAELVKNVANYDITIMRSDDACAHGFPLNKAAIAVEEMESEGAMTFAVNLVCDRSDVNDETVQKMQALFGSARMYDTIDDYDDHEIFWAFKLK